MKRHSGVLQAVKELIRELETDEEGVIDEKEERSGQKVPKQRAAMPRSDAFEDLPHDVAVARLQELKEDALQAWSDTF